MNGLKRRKEMVNSKFCLKPTPESELTNNTLLKNFVLVGKLNFVLAMVMRTEFMRKLFF